MASPAATASYIKDRTDATADIKEAGRQCQIVTSTFTSGFNPTKVDTSVNHFCLPMDVLLEDVKGSVKSEHSKYLIDAESLILPDSKMIDLGIEMEIVEIEKIMFDSSNIIVYIIFCNK